MPRVEPIKAIREYKEDKKNREEQDKLNAFIDAMEAYDGNVVTK